MIRVVAICVFTSGDKILVARGIDPSTGQPFFRPLGGEVEFGERAADALQREIHEELGLEITTPRLIGVIENLFTYDSTPAHEVVFVFDAGFSDPSVYDRPELPILEINWEGPARWESIRVLQAGTTPAYPDGLLDLLSPLLDTGDQGTAPY